MGITEAEFEQLKRNQILAGTHRYDCMCPSCFGEKPVKQSRGMNKWESLFAEELERRRVVGLITWYQFEAVRFRLADRAYYKPDFAALAHNGELILFEVKGMWREAARVRIKVASDRHPFRFVAVTKRRVRDGGGWDEELFMQAHDRIAR